jgi:catechol 2,3-dioxygenase-like lactoylglutathione lyase family enzyme
VLSGGFEMVFSPAGYAAVTSFVVIVPDMQTESGFYMDLFGLDELMRHRLTGPGIEQAIGLPKGSALELRLMGREGHFLGRVELIGYEDLPGEDRFALAKPPALGTLHCSFSVGSLESFLVRAREQGVETFVHEQVETIFGSGPMGSVFSPAGLRIDVFERG